MGSMRIGLVLSGGGTHGLAHLALLRELERMHAQISSIAGCSIGALIGAAYAAGRKSDEIFAFIKKHDLLDFFDFALSKIGLVRGEKTIAMLTEFMGAKTFGQLSIPLSVNATDLDTGEEKVWRTGSLATALRCSIAVPGIFHPVRHRGHLYVDGGVLNPLPFSLLDGRVDAMVLMDVSSTVQHDLLDPNVMSLMAQSMGIMQRELVRLRLAEAGVPYVYLSPDLSGHALFETKRHYDAIYAAGRKVVRARRGVLRRVLSGEDIREA